MKQFFVAKRFGAQSLALIDKVTTILATYEEQGYDLSLRQLYYQLVAGDLLPQEWADPATGSTNNERSYKNIGNLVSDARLAGLIDWDIIKDRGRVLVQSPAWRNPGEIVRACANQFRLDKWLRQPAYVEVMVEKQALEGVLLPVCQELGVPFTSNKGYSSSSALYEAGKRLQEKQDDGKEIHVIYLGDHDPSGIDMTRDVEDRLALFSSLESEMIQVHRIALNLDQVKKLRPPENPTKLTDSRASSYIERFGHSCWELDAIEPRALAKLVRTAIETKIDWDTWEEDTNRENKHRTKLAEFAKQNESDE